MSEHRSTPRPRAPPSESNGAFSDAGGPELDEVVRARRPNDRAPPARMVDEIGERVAQVFAAFLENFVEDNPPSAVNIPTSSAITDKNYYVAQIRGMKEYKLSTLYVDFQHLMTANDGVLATAVADNYYRFLPFLHRALHETIARHEPEYFKEHRQPGTSNSSQNGTSVHAGASSSEASSDLRSVNTDKLFTLAFYNLPLISRIRQLRSESIGHLLSISGTVTRTSEVRPELYMATFICEVCGNVVANIEQIFRYTEPTQCPNLTCGNRAGWQLDIRQSTFVDWQKVRIQENSSEIPTGSMPRTMDVILRGEIVDRAKAGEKCVFTGTLIVVPDVSQLGIPGVRPEASRDQRNAPRGGDAGGSGVTGLKALGVRDLTYRLAFLACMVTPDISTPGQASSNHFLSGQAGNILTSLNQNDPADPTAAGDKAQEEYLQSLTPAEIEDLKMMVHSDHIYSRLVNSLAPMVYGHEIVKKGLLLQLMGGVSKSTKEGLALRGDINIAIVGDPSTSKSQFLKYICSFIPRAVYTSGKASSAAGLTAAVVKDEETGEFTIEAGALMLADNGICAIDEFDKMDIGDQVAIHEAMEQQTISIAKAGIQATLNARTSILAAANPVGGRYNRKTTLRANINMSAPIMSRFDLFFVILDECNEQVDRHLAEHIVAIHQYRDEAVKPEFSTEQLQRYIRFARTFKPEFTPEARAVLVDRYKELRANDAQGGIGRNSYRITVRQLESMIRLSEAIAKANCVEEVTPAFVREAFNLLRQSIISVEKDDVDVDEEDVEDAKAEINGINGNGVAHNNEDEEMQEANAQRNGTAGPANGSSTRTKISYDRYMAILNLLARRVNEEELSSGQGVERNELVLWYLEQKEDELNSSEDLEAERSLVDKVLRRMVKDNIFMPIRGEGHGLTDADDDQQGEGSAAQQRVVFVLHPNCAVEEV